LKELKFLLNRDQKELPEHLLEIGEYRELFYQGKIEKLAEAGGFRVKL
jgi:hypothetical protein